MIATFELVKDVPGKEFYVDLHPSMDGEEFWYGLYQFTFVMDKKDPAKIAYLGMTGGPEMQKLTYTKVLPGAFVESSVEGFELAEFQAMHKRSLQKFALLTNAAQIPVAQAPQELSLGSVLFGTMLLFFGFAGLAVVGAKAFEKPQGPIYEPMMNEA